MVAVFTKIGIEEAAFERVLHSMNEILKFERLQTLNVDEAHNVVGRLSAQQNKSTFKLFRLSSTTPVILDDTFPFINTLPFCQEWGHLHLWRFNFEELQLI